MKLLFITFQWLCAFLLPVFYADAQTMNLKKDFGAVGDGVTDDTEAWNKAIIYFSKNKSSKGVLKIPKGKYRIGRQLSKESKYKYPSHSQKLENVSNLIIEGETDSRGNPVSIFKYNDGLFFGIFEKNGTPAKAYAENKRAEIGAFLVIQPSCKNITIRDIEIDGNLPKIKLGLKSKMDLEHIGIRSLSPQNLMLENLYIHHFGMDAVIIRTPYTNGYNATINNCRFEYNARQGLTFSAGKGLKVTNSKFRYTGRGGLFVSPGANVDIENHTKLPLENILFENCELYDNAGGSGSINLAGDIRNFVIKNSSIKTTGMYAIQSNFSQSRDFTFINCDIEGIIEMQVNGKPKTGSGVTRFIGCKISDNRNTTAFGLKRALINVFDQVEFENCKFYTWEKRKLIKSYNNGAGDRKKGTIVFKSPGFYQVQTSKTISDNPVNLTPTPERIKIVK